LARFSHTKARHNDAERFFSQAIGILVHAMGLDGPERPQSQEIFEIVSPAPADDLARFERVSVSEKAARHLILRTSIERDSERAVPDLTTQDLQPGDLLTALGHVRRPASTTLARLAHVVEGLASLLSDIGRDQEGRRLEALAEPLHFGVVEAAWSDALLEVSEGIGRVPERLGPHHRLRQIAEAFRGEGMPIEVDAFLPWLVANDLLALKFADRPDGPSVSILRSRLTDLLRATPTLTATKRVSGSCGARSRSARGSAGLPGSGHGRGG
jgi:hypothetical protein